jgi:hypothetical protein
MDPVARDSPRGQVLPNNRHELRRQRHDTRLAELASHLHPALIQVKIAVAPTAGFRPRIYAAAFLEPNSGAQKEQDEAPETR